VTTPTEPNTTIQVHPISEYFPLLRGTEYDELREHVKEHGLLEPIVLFEGKILDGRNRYRACLDTGTEPRFKQFPEGQDPWAWVWGENATRRHL
jgi:hypothetical protein